MNEEWLKRTLRYIEHLREDLAETEHVRDRKRLRKELADLEQQVSEYMELRKEMKCP